MPAVITCDSCDAKLRTPVAPLGKTVKCPKCGTAFVVTAANAQEVGAPKPAPSFEVVDDEPPAPKVKSKPVVKVEVEEDDEDERPAPKKKVPARAEDEDEDESPKAKKKRRNEDDEDDDRPRKKKGGKKQGGSKLPLIIGGSVLALLLLGVGGYFAFKGPRETASSGGNTDGKNPSDGKLPPGPAPGPGPGPAPGPNPGTPPAVNTLFSLPARKLPKDLLAYYPTEGLKAVLIADATTPKPGGQLHPSLFMAGGGLPKLLGAQPEQIIRLARFSSSANTDGVSIYESNTPFNLSDKAKAAGWTATTVQGGVVYKHPSRPLFVGQLTPNLLLFSETSALEGHLKRMEELLTRAPAEFKLPAGVWAALEEVSGYDVFEVAPAGTFTVQSTTKPTKFSAYGSFRSPAYNEHVNCWEFASATDAEQAEAAYKAFDVVAAANSKGAAGRTVRYQNVGTKLYRVDRQQKQ